ncbi:DnaJ-domain-containing protein [Corynespora cassiicola Philippines]|uniref:DnaJ-domain-containing protein n=1 Tax=Corynespora cassiicola Philippines TaxID=1448308 RepID=A0A2T2NDY5_CORCC|nr:DnaJ-domain-containing protein [Corynespora cassiicola Philippines]
MSRHSGFDSRGNYRPEYDEYLAGESRRPSSRFTHSSRSSTFHSGSHGGHSVRVAEPKGFSSSSHSRQHLDEYDGLDPHSSSYHGRSRSGSFRDDYDSYRERSGSRRESSSHHGSSFANGHSVREAVPQGFSSHSTSSSQSRSSFSRSHDEPSYGGASFSTRTAVPNGFSASSSSSSSSSGYGSSAYGSSAYGSSSSYGGSSAAPSACNGPDLYSVLEVSKNASADEIKRMHRKLSMKYHPDRAQGADKADATSKMAEINRAHDVLSDDKKRALYDRTGEISL